MQYFKAYWDESRGDKFDSWGRSWWYFETDDGGNVLRQVEKFEKRLASAVPASPKPSSNNSGVPRKR
jgi:hypothetical protein